MRSEEPRSRLSSGLPHTYIHVHMHKHTHAHTKKSVHHKPPKCTYLNKIYKYVNIFCYHGPIWHFCGSVFISKFSHFRFAWLPTCIKTYLFRVSKKTFSRQMICHRLWCGLSLFLANIMSPWVSVSSFSRKPWRTASSETRAWTKDGSIWSKFTFLVSKTRREWDDSTALVLALER